MKRSGGGWLLLAMSLLCLGLAGCPSPENGGEAKPDAVFDATSRTGFPPFQVQFKDLSTAGASSIRSWRWDFGDGTTSTDRNPQHTYYVAGSYNVTLTVTSGSGSSTLTQPQFILVKDVSSVSSIDSAGGMVESKGLKITVPAGVFKKPVVLGVSPAEDTVPVVASLGELLVSDIYTIFHDQEDLDSDVRYPLQLAFSFNTGMVPADKRDGAQVQVLVRLKTGQTLPIMGTVENGIVTVSATGLPKRATYAVVYRPAASVASFSVDSQIAKTATSYQWRTNSWRINYTPTALQELTALRIGNLDSTRSYDRRSWNTAQLADTLDGLKNTIAHIHQVASQVGFITPALTTSAKKEYTVLFYPINDNVVTDYDSIDQVQYTSSLFGQIVIDPAQLIIFCKNNANLSYNEAQEVDASNAFAQEFTRAIIRGYDFPKLYVSSSTDVDAYGKAQPVLFYKGLEDGLSSYIGQLTSNVLMARSLGLNEYSTLGESLFAPCSTTMPLYSTATQDFFFYLARRYSLDDLTDEVYNPFSYIGDSYKGILEQIRLRTQAGAVANASEAAQAIRIGTDIALHNYFKVGLSDVYWDYARARAYENSSNSFIRPTDYAKDENTFNSDQFYSNAVFKTTFSAVDTPIIFSGELQSGLKNIPPLSTRAILLSPGDVYGDLEVNVNAYDWVDDIQGNVMRTILYRDGNATGVELTAQDSRAVLSNFGSGGSFTRAVILLVNTSLYNTYTVSLTAEVHSSAQPPQQNTGTLGGQVTLAGTGTALEGVKVILTSSSGTTIGTTTTNEMGIFVFTDVKAGDVTLTFTKTGYVTQTVGRTVIADKVTTVFVSLQKS